MRALARMLVCATVAGCAHGPLPPLHVTPLVVTEGPGGPRAFVRASVAGEPLLLLVDTGAVQSVLPAAVARQRGLGAGSRASGLWAVDVNGGRTEMALLRGVSVMFEGEDGAGTLDFLVNPSPRAEPLFAPQDLVRPGRAVVLDLERKELRYETEEGALERLRGEGAVLHREDFSRCVLAEGPFKRNHRVVSTTVNGVRAGLTLDTGAQRTTLHRDNPAVPSLLAASGARTTVTGAMSAGQGFVLEGVPVAFADAAFSLPVLVVPSRSSCGHGYLGTDLLRSCTIVWGWSALWVRCRPPAG